ncbi:UNVERIFIED_CONTAM: DNA replication ATP-dependent helicase/nuclease JHS1 [Sesamum calycinum]|uniref:DNA replication ATP-dependent helicase/nuclease n=1 Tax=Sesamum calycinum TaxID=2727403 RepID=A0AAW2SYW1_9LAMI
MAPRKRTSSGGKKSSHHNQEPLQPSQPSKFGIQHFFERHSQTQKTLSQNSSKRDDNRPPTPISRHAAATNQNPQIVPKPIMNPKLGSNLDHAEVGAENPGGMSKLVNIESMGKYLRGVNPGVNAVNLTKIDANSSVSRNAEFRSDVLVPGCVDMGCGNPGNAFNDRVMDLKNVKKGGNFREVEASSPSQDTPVENVLPVVIDNEENQLEVSPEASKSFSVKRFKFSPGMLIKQSQDDVIDEVTWKISPVNERLHAMSKHLPGRMRVLADSTRINSMDFQQCSQQKTAMEHSAQVMLYTLLMSERYMMNIKHGLLYFLQTDQTQGIAVRRSDLIGLIMRRNDLANDLIKASATQQLPPMLQSPNMCKSCRHLSVCSIYHKVLNPNKPVIFINTDLLAAYETNDRKTLNNPIEAHIIAEVTKALVLRGIERQDIGIITPYNSQANLIQGAVSEPVEIHTIDKYQGRDKDCILLSFVRSCENPRNNTSSLLGDWHRINVALTRAKKKLIMVGSCGTLSRVPLLKLLIEKVEELSGILVVSKKEINYKLELRRCSNLR